MNKLLAVATILALGPQGYAGLRTFCTLYQPPNVDDPLVPDFNDGSYWTIDLMVDVYDYSYDDWTSTHAEATLDKGVFFEHPLGDDTPPLAVSVNLYPALEYDSFYAATEADPKNQPSYKDPSFAEEYHNAQYRMATWFDTPLNGGLGNFLVARYTMQIAPEQLPARFHVLGAHTAYGSDGYLWHYDFVIVIPEPGPLLLLGLGLVLIRRR
jgi:hypothetical protein